MEESVREVLYETRTHASRPYPSTFSPQKFEVIPLFNSIWLEMQFIHLILGELYVVKNAFRDEDFGTTYGGSVFEVEDDTGVSQIKEKWSGYRQPTKSKKWMSLFVSKRGEHVAIAVGNRITMLQKDDDYQEPSGSFTIYARNLSCSLSGSALSKLEPDC
ncbi:hypothetical protein RJ641_033675 [Dillenia turbinata]|uniref:Uncharacterized protein n=1 Tax=Dillenia turbinata TaxID=194707 RepID=A0AAN8ZJM7_9MAGN